jgi:hypothetical protein
MSVIARKLEIKIDPLMLAQAIREAERHLARPSDAAPHRAPWSLPAGRARVRAISYARQFDHQPATFDQSRCDHQAAGRWTGRRAVPNRRFLQSAVKKLRDAGLSQAKVRYIRELAARVIDGRLIFDELMTIEDEAVIEKLIEANSIGRWTAEMFLLFGLKRLDVLALGDAGLQRSARILYGKRRKSETLLRRVAEAWKPYRSIACWYLWRSLEDV